MDNGWNNTKRLLAALSLILAIGLTAPACDKDDLLGNNERGSLRGRVLEEGTAAAGLSGVRITLVSREVMSNANGDYEFTDIPVGTQQIVAYKQGYELYTANVRIREDDADDPYKNRHSFYMRRE